MVTVQKLTLIWEKPFKFSEEVPEGLKGAVGLYLFEKNSQVFYVGKTEKQGGFRRAKDHFRGQMDRVGKCVLEKAQVQNKDEINIWVAWIEDGEDYSLIDSAEKLLTWYCQIKRGDQLCNETNVENYNGKSLLLVNDGDTPANLPATIPSPT